MTTKHVLGLFFLAASLTVIHDYGSLRAPAAGKDGDQKPALSLLAVTISEVKDLDQIEGFVRSVPMRKVRISLANALPYSQWPENLSEEESKIKQAGLKLMKEMVIRKKESLEPIFFWGIDKGDSLHGDLVCRGADGAYAWNGERPSGKLGWFTIYANAMLIENGYSVYSQEPKQLNIAVTGLRELDRAKLLLAAESYAKEKTNGIWGLGDNAEFAKKLKDLSSPKR